MEEAIALGRIVAPGFFFDPLVRYAWLGCQWVGDGPGSIDPLKEVSAARERVALAISTLAEETMLHDGGDWELKHAQRVKEEKLRKEGGLAACRQRRSASRARARPRLVEEQATAVSPLAFSGTHVGGVVAPPPVVHVDVPQPIVNVEVKPPDIRVEAPVINLSLPGRSVERIPVRDARGLITKIIEREVEDEDEPGGTG